MATPRLKEKYVNEVRDQLFKELGLTNVNQIPRLEKIVINMGVGRAAGDKKLLDGAIARPAYHHRSAAYGYPR